MCAYGAGWQGVVKVTTRDISPHKGFGVLGSILIGSLKISCAKEFWGCVLRRYAHKKKKKTWLVRGSYLNWFKNAGKTSACPFGSRGAGLVLQSYAKMKSGISLLQLVTGYRYPMGRAMTLGKAGACLWLNSQWGMERCTCRDQYFLHLSLPWGRCQAQGLWYRWKRTTSLGSEKNDDLSKSTITQKNSWININVPFYNQGIHTSGI